MSREFDIKEDGNHLTLSGPLTIEYGRQLWEALRTTIARGNQAFISLAEVEDVDVVGLQILYAARKEALRDDKEFVWLGISAACSDNAALAGMSGLLGFPEPADAQRSQ
jgi:ABC-type transporter Mla MlaB component